MKAQIDIDNLKHLKQYFGDDEPDFRAYALWNSTPDVLMATAKFFYPDFFEHDDCVFWGTKFSKDGIKIYKKWMNNLKDDCIAVQRVMNHIHVSEDLGMIYTIGKPSTIGQLNTQNIYYLAEVLTQTWGLSLRNTFPDKTIHIEANRDEEIGDVIITFWAETSDKSD